VVDWFKLQRYLCNVHALSDFDYNNMESAVHMLHEIKKTVTSHSLYSLITGYCRQQCRVERHTVYRRLGFVRQEERVDIDYAKSILDFYGDAVIVMV
jgi:hypothetical protein